MTTTGIFMTPVPQQARTCGRKRGIDEISEVNTPDPHASIHESVEAEEVGQQQLEPNEVEIVRASQPARETVELEDVERPRYYLNSFKKWVFRDEAFSKLRSAYAKIFVTEAEQSMPNTDLKQRLEEIAEKVMAEDIAYLIDRDRSTWSKMLRKQRNNLDGEVEELREMREKLKRPSSKQGIKDGPLREARVRLDIAEKHLARREKIVDELKALAKLD